MISATLFFYFARQITKTVGAFYLLLVLLIGLVNLVDYFGEALRSNIAVGPQVAALAFLRVPRLVDDVIPLVVLYGSIATFVVANRRLEVVVARAAGISAWQFLLPACVSALLLGALATAAHNPIAASLQERSNALAAQIFAKNHGQVEGRTGPVWIRQSVDGIDSIIGATESHDEGLGLSGVTAYVFNPDGSFHERIDAATADYTPGNWRLQDATITAPSATPRREPLHLLATNLSPSEVKRAFLNVGAVSFWRLPALIASARRAGVPTERYELRYNVLLSRPFLFVAMVLIAANVSLRFSRSRNLGRMIITGVGVGFMLYVVMKTASDLGSGGVVPPMVAAWLPAVVATLLGVTVLLHLEDG